MVTMILTTMVTMNDDDEIWIPFCHIAVTCGA